MKTILMLAALMYSVVVTGNPLVTDGEDFKRLKGGYGSRDLIVVKHKRIQKRRGGVASTASQRTGDGGGAYEALGNPVAVPGLNGFDPTKIILVP